MNPLLLPVNDWLFTVKRNRWPSMKPCLILSLGFAQLNPTMRKMTNWLSDYFPIFSTKIRIVNSHLRLWNKIDVLFCKPAERVWSQETNAVCIWTAADRRCWLSRYTAIQVCLFRHYIRQQIINKLYPYPLSQLAKRVRLLSFFLSILILFFHNSPYFFLLHLPPTWVLCK